MPKQIKVADKEEVAAFWTEVMRGNLTVEKDQLKASEFLSKYLGMFKESKESSRQVQFVGNDSVAD